MAAVGPRVCIKALRAPLLAAAARTGRPLPELAALVDVAPASLGDASLRVPHAAAVKVWDTLAAATGDPSFGLFAARLVSAAPFDVVDLAFQHAPDIRTLLALFDRYQGLFHDANDAYREERGDVVWFVHRLRGDAPRSRHLSEFILATWKVRMARYVGGGLRPHEVHVRSSAPLDGGAAHRALFEAPVHFDAEVDALVWPRALLDQRLATADAEVAETLAAQLEHELAAVGGDPAFRRDVERALRDHLAEGEPSIAALARALATSERTLQRRLRDAGTSFREVLDDVRRELALAHLGRGATTVTDVAFLLGFADLTAFSRAFRRWTGASPAQYRRA